MCWILDDSGAVDNELNCGVFASGGAKVRNVTVILIQAKIPILVLSEGYEAMPPQGLLSPPQRAKLMGSSVVCPDRDKMEHLGLG